MHRAANVHSLLIFFIVVNFKFASFSFIKNLTIFDSVFFWVKFIKVVFTGLCIQDSFLGDNTLLS